MGEQPASDPNQEAETRSRRPNPVLVAIMVLAAVWLVAMAGSIWRSDVQRAGMKAAVLLAVAGAFLGCWAVAYFRWSRRFRQ